MEHSSLSDLIYALERGTNIHICVAFMNNYGNRKTLCAYSQAIHDRPICLAVKRTQEGLSGCYRCRMTVQKYVIRNKRSLGGYCSKGVYEYCRPVVYEDKVICVIFIGNILTDDPGQRMRLQQSVGETLLSTMEQNFSPEDCVRTADILESYILLLFDRYGVENMTYDPLVRNIKNYIRENLSYELDMAELAAAFNYSEKYLGRLFKQRTGHTVKEYCNRIRISQARALLTDTALSVADIASQVGFNNITYFDRQFQKTVGISPRAYRNSLRGRKKGT